MTQRSLSSLPSCRGTVCLVGYYCCCAAFWLHTAHALAFAPFPAPRFDTFAEHLVGSWEHLVIVATSAEDEPLVNKNVQTASVEEVMRSCGGAVQGIREPLLRLDDDNNNNDNDSIYLNRANDGFVYFDNGSYSLGPVQLRGSSSSSDETSDNHLFLSSLTLGNGLRVVCHAKVSSLQGFVTPQREK